MYTACPSRPSLPDPRLQEYMAKHGILLYLQDAASLMLEARAERPLEFVADYFSSVLAGTHVLLRDYAYVNACERNRAAFLDSCRESFADLPPDEPLSASELSEMLRMLCPDFPLSLPAHAVELCGEEPRQPFRALLDATLLCFYYADFLERAAEVFETCDTRSTGAVNRNVLLLTLRQMIKRYSGSAAGITCPPAAVFDQVFADAPGRGARTPSDVTLLQMQAAFIRAPALRERVARHGPGEGGYLVMPPPRAASCCRAEAGGGGEAEPREPASPMAAARPALRRASKSSGSGGVGGRRGGSRNR